MIKRVLQQTFTLLNVDRVKLGVQWNYKNVISPYYRLYYIDEGKGELSNASASLALEPGYLYIVPSFTLCGLNCDGYLSQYFAQFFEETANGISLFTHNRSIGKVKATFTDAMLFRRLLEINPGRGLNRSDDPRVYEKDIFYKEYQELNGLQSMAVFLETQGILLQLVSRFMAPASRIAQQEIQIPAKILDAISYIELNLSKELTVSGLAQRANQNCDYFSRRFQQHTGNRPVHYINQKRIERAQYLMVTTQMSIAQIAAQAGYENVFYFSRMFKKITGLAPGKYHRRHDLS